MMKTCGVNFSATKYQCTREIDLDVTDSLEQSIPPNDYLLKKSFRFGEH